MNNYEIIQQLTKLPLTTSQIKIALCVFVQTKKYNKESDAISLSQFVEKTGVSEPQIKRTIPQLCKMGIIEKTGSGVNKSKLPQYKFTLCKDTNIITEEHKKENLSPVSPMILLPVSPTTPTLNTEYVSKFCIFIILIYICGFSLSEEEKKMRGLLVAPPRNVIRIGRLISFYFGAEQIKKIGKDGKMVSEDWKYLEDEFLLARIYVEHNPKFTHVTKTGLFILRTLSVHYGKDMVAWGIRETAKRTQYDPALIYLQELLALKAREK
jgi:DNA-binding Lrp family transcriptional regulator